MPETHATLEALGEAAGATSVEAVEQSKNTLATSTVQSTVVLFK